MGTTTNLALPYPGLNDSDNVPKDIKALADALDAPGVVFRPYVELVAAAATTGIVTATETKVNLATTNHIDGGSTYFTVASSVITIVQAGVYNLSGFADMATKGTNPYISIFKTSGTTKYLAIAYGQGTVTASDVTLAANDTIQLIVSQNSGSNQSTYHVTGAGSLISRLAIRKVG